MKRKKVCKLRRSKEVAGLQCAKKSGGEMRAESNPTCLRANSAKNPKWAPVKVAARWWVVDLGAQSSKRPILQPFYLPLNIWSLLIEKKQRTKHIT